MGRPSKLTDKQWEAIEKRLLAGEKASVLGREFKVSPATISERFSKKLEKVKTVANQIVETDKALKSLTVSEQISAITLADELRCISENLASAAGYGALTARRLAGMAHTQSAKIDEVEPLKSAETLQGIAILTKMANSSSEIGINLLRANKETVDDMNKRGATKAPSGLTHFYGESDN